MYIIITSLSQSERVNSCSSRPMPTVHLLDYVAGNIRSLVNAIEKVGYAVEWIRSPEEVANAQVSGRV